MSKVLKTVARVAAPVAGNMILPGIGGIAGGALGGGLGGGGLKGALLGAAGGALTGDSLGTIINTPIAGGVGPTKGSGILGAATRAAGSGGLSGALASGIRGAASLMGQVTGGGANLGNLASNAYSAVAGSQALRDAKKAQLSANQQALNAISPFAQSGTAANARLSGLLGLGGENQDDIIEQLRNSPGYQFRLEQGNRNLERAQSARGDFFSGRALQEAQKMGQGLADQTYNDYIRQLQQQSGQGLVAAGQMGNLYTVGGDIRANAGLSESDLYNRSLANVLTPRRYEEDML